MNKEYCFKCKYFNITEVDIRCELQGDYLFSHCDDWDYEKDYCSKFEPKEKRIKELMFMLDDTILQDFQSKINQIIEWINNYEDKE